MLITLIFLVVHRSQSFNPKYEQEKLAVKQKYELAKQTPLQLGDGIIESDCGINPDSALGI